MPSPLHPDEINVVSFTPLELAMHRLEENALLFTMEQERALEESQEHNAKIRILMQRAGRAHQEFF